MTWKLLTIFIFFGILLMRGDGFFPFPKNWPENVLLAICIFHTFGLLFTSFFYIKQSQKASNDQPNQQTPNFNSTAISILWPLLILAILALHYLQFKRFQIYGYQFNLTAWVLAGVFSAIPAIVITFLMRQSKAIKAKDFFIASWTSSLALKILPIFCFPITAWRSDLLPIIEKGTSSLLKGDNPYLPYLLDNEKMVQIVRFPGTLLAYVPSLSLGVDLRWTTLFYETVFFIGIYRLYFKNEYLDNNNLTNYVLVLSLMLFPYWHFRHELYEPPFWVLLLIAFTFLKEKLWLFFSMSAGLLLATHHWGVLFFPTFFIYLKKNVGLKKTLRYILLSLLLSFTILSLIIQGEFTKFYENVLGYYINQNKSGQFHLMSMYFSALVSKLGYSNWLFPIQITLQFALIIVMYKKLRNFNQIPVFLGISLLALLVFNSVAWTYQFMLVGILFTLNYFETIQRTTRKTQKS